MKQKKFMIAAVMVGCFVLVGTALASTYSVTKIVAKSGHVKKTLTVGTNRNKGKLLVKGYLRNPVKGKVLRVKDSMKVTGNLRVNGILQGNNIVSADNLGTGVVAEGKIADGAVTAGKLGDGSVASAKIADDAVTSSKIDMGMDGVVKAGAYATQATCDSTALSRSFNNLTSSNVTCSRSATGHYIVTFGSGVDNRYIQVLPYKADDVIIPMIQATSSTTVSIYFYTGDGSENDVDPTGFYINVY